VLPEANESARQEDKAKAAEGQNVPWRFDLLGLILRGAVGKRKGD
jgi:hypothetical protein